MAMPVLRRVAAAVVALALAGLATTQLAIGKKKEKPGGGLDERKRALHALNRLTFGPRPGELERVAQFGVDQWIDEQLRPEKIDDSALNERLASFRTLRMNTREIVENFPNNQVIRQVAEGKEPMPMDPARHAVYQAQVEKYENKLDKKAPVKGGDRRANFSTCRLPNAIARFSNCRQKSNTSSRRGRATASLNLSTA